MFGKPKNYDAILTKIKSVHGLEHDATESEVDAHLEECKSYEDVLAAAKEEAKKTVQPDLDNAQTALKNAENRAEKAEGELETAQTTVDDQKKQIEKLQADLKAANEKIAELNEEPAANPTKGATEPPESGRSAKSYDNDPVTLRARRMSRR